MGSVPGFSPVENGLHYPNDWPPVPDVTISVFGQTIALGNASNGLCGGMAFAVRDLFEAGRTPPPGQANPSPGSPAFQYVVARLLDSFDLPVGVLQDYTWMQLPSHDTAVGSWVGAHGTSWRTINDTMPVVRQTIESGRPCPLGLVCSAAADPMQLGQNHQVLAYAYEDGDPPTTVHLYDPNHPDTDVTIAFDHTNPAHTTDFQYSTGDHQVRGFFATPYSPGDPSPLFQDGSAAPPAARSELLSLGVRADVNDGRRHRSAPSPAAPNG